jgi:hypothetical protein
MADRLYTVDFQNQVRALVGNQLTDMYEIHYSGPNGIKGWVRIPVATATREQVDTLIQRQLDDQLGIAGLGTL